MSALLETAKQAVALALKKGAKEAGASAYKSRDVTIGWRDGKVEKVSEATTRGVSVQLYVDGRYTSVSTSDLRPEALDAFQLLCRTEGIIPALEPSHAIAAVARRAPEMPKEAIILANLCGRGDKDIFTVAEALGVEM